jgi:hypothetical protein
MARTVSYPVAIAVRLILEVRITCVCIFCVLSVCLYTLLTLTNPLLTLLFVFSHNTQKKRLFHSIFNTKNNFEAFNRLNNILDFEKSSCNI